ncbi:MAG: manganese efflux pump [Victivallales bacterium]|nr:manganese efflux pump [Victivallales bacterium]
MSFAGVLIIALGLAMDAFTVAVAMGATLRKQFKPFHIFMTAVFFGVFQAVMPLLGWLCGKLFAGFVNSYGHWVAFAMLAGIGTKMIWEALKRGDDEEIGDFCFYHLTALAFATSIDAFAVGISFACMMTPVMAPAIKIGGVTFILTLIGGVAGKVFGHIFENKFEFAGGAVLILLGFKILLFG